MNYDPPLPFHPSSHTKEQSTIFFQFSFLLLQPSSLSTVLTLKYQQNKYSHIYLFKRVNFVLFYIGSTYGDIFPVSTSSSLLLP